MDEYIKREDALDAVLFALVGTGLQSSAIYALRDITAADVVPKSEIASKIIREVEQILEVKILNIEEDLFHGIALRGEVAQKNGFEDVLVELAELKKKYTEGKNGA